jgi:hypothetical protein
MKIQTKQLNSVEGSVLCVTLLSAAVLAILLGSYLSLVGTHSLSVERSQSWNTALVVAEGGVEEAMAHLNCGITTNNLATNSWVDIGGGNYAKTNSLGDSYSVVTIQTAPAVTNANPVILSTAYVPGPISTPALTRTVRVETKIRINPALKGAMVVTSTLDWAGQGCTSDSFDSSNTNYSTGGTYDPAKARDHGDISTLSSADGAINIGNGQVKGSVHTGPGGTQGVTATVGSGGSVGDSAWVDNKKSGWEDGHFADDETRRIDDVTLPDLTWMNAKWGRYNVSGLGKFQYKLDNSSPWKITDLNGSIYVGSKDVVLYVRGGFKVPTGGQIYIAPGASLTIYVESTTATIDGQGIVNATGIAGNFNYYGLPSNTALNFGANASFVGNIYAPEAFFTLGGGGSTTYDFVGRSVTKAVKMNGHYHFHYDEALPLVASFDGYAAMSWNEL